MLNSQLGTILAKDSHRLRARFVSVPSPSSRASDLSKPHCCLVPSLGLTCLSTISSLSTLPKAIPLLLVMSSIVSPSVFANAPRNAIVSSDDNNDEPFCDALEDHILYRSSECWQDVNLKMLSAAMDCELSLSKTSHQEASKVMEEWRCDHHHPHHYHAMTTTTTTMVSTTVTPAVSDNDEDSCNMQEDMAILMEVDEEIGSNFLNEDVFGGGAAACAAVVQQQHHVHVLPEPYGVMNHFHGYHDPDGDDERSLAPLLDEDRQDAVVMALDEMSTETTTTSTTIAVDDPEQYQKLLEKLVESMKRSEETRKSLTMKTPKTEKYGRSKTVSGDLSSIEKSSKQLKDYFQKVEKAATAV